MRIFLLLAMIFSLAFTDKDLSFSLSTSDSRFSNWDEIKDFTKLEGQVKVLENGTLEIPKILLSSMNQSLRFKLFEVKGNDLELLKDGIFVLENDMMKYIRTAGKFYLKLESENPMLLEIVISATRVEDFSIKVFTKSK